MRLRGALLGAGNIALKSHAPQWAGDERLRREVEIVAVADLSPSNRERMKEILPGARAYTLAEELLEREEIDFCDICTPPFTHRILVERAADRGLHVVCEKPLVATLDDVGPIVAAVRRAGIVFQPCHQYHHSPQWQAVQALLPRIGRIYFAEYEVQRTEANPGNPNWSPTWRTDRSLAGGGILADHGAHILYQLGSVLGEPQTVQATVRTLKHRGYEVEDTALVTLDYGGTLASVRLSWAARGRSVQFRFVGEAGELTGDDTGIRLRAATTEDIRFDQGMSQNSSHAEWYAPLLAGFVDRVRAADRGTEALDEAVCVGRLISRAYESSELGRSLPLHEEILAEPEMSETVERALATFDFTEAPPRVETQPEAAPRPSRRGRIIRWAGLHVLVGVLVWAFYDVNWASLGHALTQARPGWLALAAAVNLVVIAFQAARWLALVRPLAPAATLGQAFKAMIVGFSVSTVVPARAGELARVEWFGRATGLSRVSVVGSILLDQLVNAAGLLVGVALLPMLIDVPLWLRPTGYLALALFLVGTMLVLALRPVSTVPVPESETRSRVPLRRVTNFLARVRNGFLASRDPRALAMSFGASFMAWGLEINVASFSLRAVDLHLHLTAAILVLVAVNLALAIPFAPPANVGTLELGAILALHEFGVPKEQALAFAVCYHLLQVVPIGILGFAFMTRDVSRRGRLFA